MSDAAGASLGRADAVAKARYEDLPADAADAERTSLLERLGFIVSVPGSTCRRASTPCRSASTSNRMSC